MTPGFGAGLVIPDLWQQEGIARVATGKRRGGAGADRIGQDLRLRAALSEPENSGGVHRPDPRSSNARSHAASKTTAVANHAS